MVVTRKRSDSVLSNQDEATSQNGEETPVVRRSSRIRSTVEPQATTSKASQPSADDKSGSPVAKSGRGRKTKTTSESESEQPVTVDESSVSPVRKLTRGRRARTSESEQEEAVESKAEEQPVETQAKRTRTASTSSTKSLDVEVSVRRPSSRNTPLKTIVEHVAVKSTKKSDSSPVVRRSTRRAASEPESDGELVEITTPRRATRKSLKVSAEPVLGVVSEEIRNAIETKAVTEEIEEILPTANDEVANKAEATLNMTSGDVEKNVAKNLVSATESSESVLSGSLLERNSDAMENTVVNQVSIGDAKNVETVNVPSVSTLESGNRTEKKNELLSSDEKMEVVDSSPKMSASVDHKVTVETELLPNVSGSNENIKTVTENLKDGIGECVQENEKMEQAAQAGTENVQPVAEQMEQDENHNNETISTSESSEVLPTKQIEETSEITSQNIAESPRKNDDFTLVVPESPVRDLSKPVSQPVLNSERNAPIIIPRGKNVSGRFWRDPKERFKNNFKDKGLKSSKEQYEKLRMERMRVKLLEEKIKEERKQKIEELRKRQQLKGQRKEVNDRRGEVVQVIKNTAKLKTLSKKQKRLIQKRDTTNMIKS